VSSARPIRTVAIIEPLGDWGIGTYSYELAEGLAANGIRADVYTAEQAAVRALPVSPGHRTLPVLGTMLYKQRSALEGRPSTQASPASPPPAPEVPAPAGRAAARRHPFYRAARNFLASAELVLHLKRRGYDLIWTQWPDTSEYGLRFWHWCRRLGLPVVHTVHNVLPHEDSPRSQRTCRAIYRNAAALVVHSEYSRQELLRFCPEVAYKTLVSWHGAYTLYPRRPGARALLRRELNIGEDQPALLFFGGIRPYKNIDAVLHAFRDDRFRDAVLIVSGEEARYPDLVPGDRLGRSKRIARELGICDRVRFLYGPSPIEQFAQVLETADVLLLPYLKSYGSGALMIGLTFGLHIVATPTGGMDEYLRRYPRSTILAGASSDDLVRGMADALTRLCSEPRVAPGTLVEFDWRHITGNLVPRLQEMLG